MVISGLRGSTCSTSHLTLHTKIQKSNFWLPVKYQKLCRSSLQCVPSAPRTSLTSGLLGHITSLATGTSCFAPAVYTRLWERWFWGVGELLIHIQESNSHYRPLQKPGLCLMLETSGGAEKQRPCCSTHLFSWKKRKGKTRQALQGPAQWAAIAAAGPQRTCQIPGPEEGDALARCPGGPNIRQWDREAVLCTGNRMVKPKGGTKHRVH